MHYILIFYLKSDEMLIATSDQVLLIPSNPLCHSLPIRFKESKDD